MAIKQRSAGEGITELTTSKWYNPTHDTATIVLHRESSGGGNGPAFKITIGPGETKEISSEYDRAIQMVDCGRPECRQGAWFCKQGHPGQVIGGIAPKLVQVGRGNTLDPTLDPQLAEQKQNEALLAAQSLARNAAEQAMVVAAAKVAESKAKPEPKPEPKPAGTR